MTTAETAPRMGADASVGIAAGRRAAQAPEDPIRDYDILRARCPVAHDAASGWTVLAHGETVRVLEDPTTFSSAVSAHHPAVPNGFDPPVHTAYRAVLDRYLTAERADAFEPECRQVAAELVDTLPRGIDIEAIERFAVPFAVRAQRRWLGWPHTVEDSLRRWMGENHRAMRSGDRVAIDAAARSFDETVLAVLDERRSAPAVRPRDITQELLEDRIGDRPFTDTELVSILRNWTAGELGTISASVGILVRYLAADPELQEQLRRELALIPHALDEILRIHPPLMANRRVAACDAELGGRAITAGDRVTVLWASANRDESVFGDPDRFDPDRNAEGNLLFGRGIHACPGADLARMELRVLVEELLAGTRRVELAESAPDHAEYPAGGLQSLHMRVLGLASERR